MATIDYKCSPEVISITAKKRDKRSKLIAKKIESFLNWYVEQPEVKKLIKEQINSEIRKYLYL